MMLPSEGRTKTKGLVIFAITIFHSVIKDFGKTDKLHLLVMISLYHGKSRYNVEMVERINRQKKKENTT